MTHAGFWKRFLAYILDFLVLCFFTIIVSFFVQIIHAILGGGTSSSVQYTESDVSMFSTIVSMLSGFFPFVCINWLYYAIMESSKLQGTLGKRALGIIVVDKHYGKISFLRASGRFWGAALSKLSLFVGYMMAGFTKNKQALHDMLAGTYVVDKPVMAIGFEAYATAGHSNTMLDQAMEDGGDARFVHAREGGWHMHAGFWRRFCANLIDGIILYVSGMVIGFIMLLLLIVIGGGLSVYLTDWFAIYLSAGYVFYYLISIAIGWLYYAIFESSKLQGTPGKKALGIIVVNSRYGRITFGHASGRYWSKIVSMLTLYVGYMMAGFTKNKQALHDMIASTYVVDKNMLEYNRRMFYLNQATGHARKEQA
ncbi:RDD family protein [compost metagenome]